MQLARHHTGRQHAQKNRCDASGLQIARCWRPQPREGPSRVLEENCWCSTSTRPLPTKSAVIEHPPRPPSSSLVSPPAAHPLPRHPHPHPPDPPCAGEAVQEHGGPRTVRTSGYPAGDWLPTTPVDVPSYPIAAEPLALPRILLPSPGAWLEGRLQLVVGGSAACAGEPLVGQAALAAPAAPRADHRRAGGCSEGQEGPRRGVGCAGARVCRVRGRGLGLAGWPRSGGVGGRVLPTWQTS